MDLVKGIPTAKLEADELIELVDSCCLCGSKLWFNHATDFKKQEVHEEGRCPTCGIRNKVNTFTLQ